MTSPLDLLEIAKTHQGNPGVRILLLSISENQTHAASALALTQSTAARLTAAATLEDPSYLGGSTALDMAAYATKAATYTSRLSADLMNLACILQSLGEDIRY